MKKALLLMSFVLCGCSMTYSPVEHIYKNEYKITTYGNAFSSSEDLNAALDKKAAEVCGSNNFEYIPNLFGKNVSLENKTAYGLTPGNSDITTGKATAKIRCLESSQKE